MKHQLSARCRLVCLGWEDSEVKPQKIFTKVPLEAGETLVLYVHKHPLRMRQEMTTLQTIQYVDSLLNCQHEPKVSYDVQARL